MAFDKPALELPFTNGFYQARSEALSRQRCINYYPVIHPVPAQSGESLQMCEGIEGILSDAGGVNRGFVRANNIAYAVMGQNLYKIERTLNPDLTETYTRTQISGTIAGSERVIMVRGFNPTSDQIVIVVPGVAAYAVVLDVITDLSGQTNFSSFDGTQYTVDDVVNINGFFVFLQTGTNVVFQSELNDALTYEALAFERVTQITKVIGIIKFRNQLFVMGEDETIPYVFFAGENFFFQGQANSVIDSGLRAVHAKTRIRQSFVYLGGGSNAEPAVWLYSGGSPQKISTHAVDEILQNQRDLSDAFILNFSRKGGEFICLIVNDECLCYDLATGRWHERRSQINDEPRRWRVNSIVQVFEKLLVGDFEDGRIGIIDDQVYSEYGNSIHRSFAMQPFDNKGKAIRISEAMLSMDVGFGGSVAMDYSDDGYTWSNDVIRSAGDLGQYGRRVAWDRLGSTPFFRTFRFGTSDAVKCNINKVLAIAS